MLLVVCGVSGTGKSTIGRLLVERCGGRFFDADDFHSPENIRKMRNGTALTDADRQDWLAALAGLLRDRAPVPENTVLACSALKAAYRERLAQAAPGRVRFALLDADFEVIRERMTGRRDHFMPPELLESQFETLEVTDDLPRIDAAASPGQIVDEIIRRLPSVCQP